MLNEAWQECCHAERVSATFQCVSTAKVHLLTNTRMFAGVVFADILEAVMTAFTVLAHWKAFSASRFRLSSEAGNADRNLSASRFRLSKDKTEPL